MPGVLRSRGCQPCKIRKIKCDETWPTCAKCRRRRIPCTGPTELIKWVPNGDHSTGQTLGQKNRPTREGSTAAEVQSMSRFQSIVTSSAKGSVSSFRLSGPLRPALGTTADHVAGRLVGHLGSTGEHQMITQTEILSHLPKRISANQSLHDSIDLLCSVWSNRRSGEAAVEFINLPLYGKAIRSLSRMLTSDEAFTVETLASIVILQRAEALFDTGHQLFVHTRGIATILSRMRPPKPDDAFQASVFAETYSVMIPHWMMTGWNPVIDEPPWRNAVVSGLTEYMGVPELKPFVDAAFTKNNRICEKVPLLLQGIMVLVQDPKHETFPSTSPFATQITHEFMEAESSSRESVYAIFHKALDLGKIMEEDHPTPLTRTRYNFSSTHLAQSLTSYLSFHLYILRLRYQWNLAFQPTAASQLYIDFQDACTRIWKFVPFMQNAWLFLLRHLQSSLAISFEVANPEQQEYLLSIFEDLDRHGRKAPRTRQELKDKLEKQSLLLEIEWR